MSTSSEATWSYEATAAAVSAHALENYSKGWSVIVECMSTQEIATELRNHRIWSESGAIKHFQKEVNFHKEAALNAAC